LHEETGLSVSTSDITLHDTNFVQHPSGQHILVVIYITPRASTTGSPTPGSDAGAARFWDLEELISSAERIEPGYIDNVANQIQLQNCAFPPTDPDTLESMFKHSSKVNRHFQDFEDFVTSAVQFYDRNDLSGEAKKINSAFSFSSSSSFSDSEGIDMEKVKKKVRQTV
jgi:hypothetical protein